MPTHQTRRAESIGRQLSPEEQGGATEMLAYAVLEVAAQLERVADQGEPTITVAEESS